MSELAVLALLAAAISCWGLVLFFVVRKIDFSKIPGAGWINASGKNSSAGKVATIAFAILSTVVFSLAVLAQL